MASSRPQVLVIDDDDMICMMLLEILGGAGFVVERAADASEGLARYHDIQPDLILLDVMMSGIDGFACLVELRRLPGAELLPIVMMTALDDIESIDRAFKLGATDFIAKPIHWATLAHRLNYMLRATDTLQQLARSESALRAAQRAARLGHWELQLDPDRLVCSDEVYRIVGIDRQATDPDLESLFQGVHAADAGRLQEAFRSCRLSGAPFNLDFRLALGDGGERVIHAQGSRARTPGARGEHECIHGLFQDITEYRRIEDQVRYLSLYDSITGLPNLAMFKEILAKGFAYCERHKSGLAAFFIGIDKFSRITEVYGRTVGDCILKEFGERLTKALRESDFVAAAGGGEHKEPSLSRLSGTEFGVVIHDVIDVRTIAKIVERLLKTTEKPYSTGEQEIFLAMSVGIGTFPGDGADVDSFIKDGEIAMHHAMESGQNRYQFSSKSLNVEAFNKLVMENSLRRALDREELILHYQPQFDLPSGRIVGMEALVRWRHPDMGMVSPAHFIPLAEQSGLIGPIGDWVLETVCRQSMAWKAAGMQPMPLAVNISSVQFMDPDFQDKISRILAKTGIAPSLLVLEMTESILMGNVNETLQTLKRLKDMGVVISLDDFGTGYSSLSYLTRFPIDELKIDRSFVMRIAENKEDATIASAIIGLGNSLNLKVISEGVETKEQAAFLETNGCQRMQGFLFCKPLPADEVFLLALENQAVARATPSGAAWIASALAAG